MLYHGLSGISMTHFEKPCWQTMCQMCIWAPPSHWGTNGPRKGLSFEDFKSLYNYWGFSEFHSPGNNNRNTHAEEEEEEEPQDFAHIDP